MENCSDHVLSTDVLVPDPPMDRASLSEEQNHEPGTGDKLLHVWYETYRC